MSFEQSPFEGVLVTDETGKIVFADGFGDDQRVRSLAADKAWIAEARDRRLQLLIVDRRTFVVLASPLGRGNLLMFSSPNSKPVIDFIGSVDFAYDIFEYLLTNPFDAMTVVDSVGRIVYISPVHEGFFGLAHGEANGKPVKQVIENSRLDKVVSSGKAEVGEIQRMRGVERVVTRVPIKKNEKIVGAIGRVMFKGPQQVETLSRRINALEGEVEFYKREAAALRARTYVIDDLVGDSPAMQRLRREILKVAPLELPILIIGESGSGKELVAHALHRLSPRRDSAFVMVNAAALPATLVESELFGYEPGAFTGADRKGRKGKFEQAAEGSIFLDEIGDMPIEVQAKLLRVLQDRMIERIGGERAYEVDFRLVSATNHNLQDLVANGKFRLDLYYRISPIILQVPPLRSRIDDIPLLAKRFMADVATRHQRPIPTLSEGALSYLMEQSWPGNVRQLRHEVERAFVFAEEDLITADAFAQNGNLRATLSAGFSVNADPVKSVFGSLRDTVDQVEIEMIQKALAQHNGNKKKAAQELGISRSYLYKVLGEVDER
jgi:PAS domain S-box-containing protein